MLYDLMKRRRSVRKYLSKAVPQEKLFRILQAGTLAPSGADQRPYIYIIVDDPKLKRRIREECEAADRAYHEGASGWMKEWLASKGITPEKPFLTEAPCLVVVVGETDKPYWLASAWVSIAYIILAAEEEGLATLTYTPGKMGFLKELLNLAENHQPVAIIPVGYAGEKLPAKETRVEGKIFYNRFGGNGGLRCSSGRMNFTLPPKQCTPGSVA